MKGEFFIILDNFTLTIDSCFFEKKNKNMQYINHLSRIRSMKSLEFHKCTICTALGVSSQVHLFFQSVSDSLLDQSESLRRRRWLVVRMAHMFGMPIALS